LPEYFPDHAHTPTPTKKKHFCFLFLCCEQFFGIFTREKKMSDDGEEGANRTGSAKTAVVFCSWSIFLGWRWAAGLSHSPLDSLPAGNVRSP
jgi:hypothetical protein